METKSHCEEALENLSLKAIVAQEGTKWEKEYREFIDRRIMSYNWRFAVVVVFDRKILDETPGLNVAIDGNERFQERTVDVLDSFVPAGMKDESAHHWVRMRDFVSKREFAVPHAAVAKFSPSGKSYWLFGRFVIEPWEMIEPIHRYLENGLIYHTAKCLLPIRPKRDEEKSIFHQFVEETLYPFFTNNKPEDNSVAYPRWVDRLSDYYLDAVRLNRDEFRDYAIRSEYTGPYTNEEERQRLSGMVTDDNPFFAYWDYLVWLRFEKHDRLQYEMRQERYKKNK